MFVLVRECKADFTLLAYLVSIDFTVSIDMSWIIHLPYSVLSMNFTLAVKIFYTSRSRLNWRVGMVRAIRAHYADHHWVVDYGPKLAQMDGPRRPLESRRTRARVWPRHTPSLDTDIDLIGLQNRLVIHRLSTSLARLMQSWIITYHTLPYVNVNSRTVK